MHEKKTRLDKKVFEYMCVHGIDTRFIENIDEDKILGLDEINSIRSRLVDIKAEISYKNIDRSSSYYNGVTAALDFMLGHLDYRSLVDPNSNETQISNRESELKNGDIINLRGSTGYIVFDKGPMAMVPSPKHKGWLSPTEAAMFCGKNFFTNEMTVTNYKYIVKLAVPNREDIVFTCPNPLKLTRIQVKSGFRAVVLRKDGLSKVDAIIEAALASRLLVDYKVSETIRDRKIVTVSMANQSSKEEEIANMESIIREVISIGRAGMLTIF